MYINLLTLHRWTSIFRNYLKTFLTGSAPFYSGFATIFVSFNCQKWNHALYILFFVGIGTNSNFNCIPNPCASFFTILRLGFLVPFIICFILLCQFFFCLWCLLRFFYKSIGQYRLLARLIASSISYIFVSL